MTHVPFKRLLQRRTPRCLRTWIAILGVCGSTILLPAQNLEVARFERESKRGILVDIRTPGELAEGMISGAMHVDFYEAAFNAKMEALGKNRPIYLYCRSGGRSGQALIRLKAAGFTDVHHLQGGILAWIAARKPLVKN